MKSMNRRRKPRADSELKVNRRGFTLGTNTKKKSSYYGLNTIFNVHATP